MAGIQPRKSFKVGLRLEPFYTGGAVQISPNGEMLACSCGDEIKLVSSKTGSVIKTLVGDGEPITALTFSQNGRNLFTSSRSLQSKRWDVEKGETTRVWKAHEAPVADMAVDASGWLLATGSADRSARVWDSEKGHCTHSFRNHKGIVLRVLFHPDPRKLVLFTASDEAEIKVWDLTSKAPLATLDGHFSAVTGLAVSPCGKILLSGARDKVVNVWNLATYKKASTVPVFEALEGVLLLPPGLQAHTGLPSLPKKSGVGAVYFVTAGEGGTVKVWRSDTGKCVWEAASGGKPKVQQEGDQGEEAGEGSEPQKAGWAVEYIQSLPSGKGVLCATADARLLAFESRGHETLVLTKQLIGTNDEVIDMKFSGSDNSKIIVVSNSEQVRVQEVDGLGCVGFLQGHSDMVLCCDACQEDPSDSSRSLVLTGSKDQSMRVWDSSSSLCLGVGQGHVGAVTAVAFARPGPAGGWAVSGGADKLLKVWDLSPLPGAGASAQSPVKLRTKAAVAAHDKDINAISVAPNNQLLCTGSQDRTARLWRLPELILVSTLKGHKRGVWSVEFSPTDQVVATGSGDRSIRLWSLADGACLRTFEGHTASVLRLSFVNQGTQVVSVGSDGLLKLWTVKTSECVNTFDEHLDKVWALASSEVLEMDAASRTHARVRVVTGGADGRINIWEDSTEEESLAREAAAQGAELAAQALQSALQRGDYQEALRGALSLKQPDRARLTFHDLTQKQNPTKAAATLGSLLRSLDPDALALCLEYVREWNTNSRHCHTSAWVLQGILRVFSPRQITSLPNSQDLLAGIQSYNLRHFSRMDRLVRSTYLLDFTLASMTVLEDQPTSDELLEIEDEASEPSKQKAQGETAVNLGRSDQADSKEEQENTDINKDPGSNGLKKVKGTEVGTPKRKAKQLTQNGTATPKSKMSKKKSKMVEQ